MFTEVYMFQYSAVLCSKCSSSLASSINVSLLFVGEKIFLLVEYCFCYSNHRFNLACASLSAEIVGSNPAGGMDVCLF